MSNHKIPRLARIYGCWYMELGGKWIPCGTWERVIIILGGHL